MTADIEKEWWALNAEATEAYWRGAYTEAVVTAERAQALARHAFGPTHPNPLTTPARLGRDVPDAGPRRRRGGAARL
jgi:hypothetical protein